MAAPTKKPKTLSKYGLKLTLPEGEPPAELVWLMADAEESDSPFAEATLQVKLLEMMLGKAQAQKVREKGLSITQLANLIADVQDSYGVDSGK